MDRQDSQQLRIWSNLKSSEQTQIILFWLVVIAIVIGFISSFEDGHLDWRGLGGNLGTELFGAALTFYIFDRLIQRRDREQQNSALIRQLRSGVNSVARQAAEELRDEGWLDLRGLNLAGAALNGVDLRGADLNSANLIGADLREAILTDAKLQAELQQTQLQKATLTRANLEDAMLWGANLEGAHLNGANLKGTNLLHANLRGADLSGTDLSEASAMRANLRGADLSGAKLLQTYLMGVDLEGADLAKANLRGTTLSETNLKDARNLKSAIFDEVSVLPDDTTWTPETDLDRFTRPTHPDFWRSDDPRSPAYRSEADSDAD